MLALPGQDVQFIRGSIIPSQVGMHRPSYINAILIQSRGVAGEQPCDACRRARTGPRPFPECRRVAGHFGGACANCKWRDHASRCSVRGDEDDDVVVIGERRLGPPGPGDGDEQGGNGGGDGSSRENAIVLA